MGTRINIVGGATGPSRSIPTTGMRGGLGRTLLTAFLILTILPLALVGGYAVQQNRENLQREAEAKLRAIAVLKGETLRRWFEEIQTILSVSALLEHEEIGLSHERWWSSLTQQVSNLVGVVIFDVEARTIWSTGTCVPSLHLLENKFSISYPDNFITLLITEQEHTFVFCLSASALEQVIHSEEMVVGKTGNVYLVHNACIWSGATEMYAQNENCSSPSTAIVSNGKMWTGLYTNHLDVPVIGVYYPLTDLSMNGMDDYALGILVEQAQSETLESNDRMAATFIAIVLAVALTTTAISAVVIRQITRPVILLTESALAMAEGDLDQHLTVTSRDEIGILTYVFNEMSSELKSLYDDLEAKVAERTAMLQKANYQIQRRVLHFQASQEVSRAITSISDPDVLLSRVVDAIQDRFRYASVGVYLVEPGGGLIRLRTVSPQGAFSWPTLVYTGDGSIVERAIRKQVALVESQEEGDEDETQMFAAAWYRRTLSRVVVPLQMEERVSGALAVLSTEYEGVQFDEVEVLEILARQIVIALENARAYERERLAAKQMEEAEAFKIRFLSNMSHELREPLNTIIGFSRLMLKGIDGPLNDQQQQDLDLVYNNGQRLLFLINDMLTSSQLQAGLMELKFQPVDLRKLVSEVMPTASALVRGKAIELVQEIPEDIPMVRADPARLRQILVQLFTNAAKFTQKGSITLRAWVSEAQIYISVRDTGMGIPPEDRDRIFSPFERSSSPENRRAQGAGLGLALCKEFVELHGGQIWVVSEVGLGSTFTFSLPCYVTLADGACALVE
ncbi:MAG: HAMP domain-containing protein [Anaerolineae bacterium]|nr:HAMP domain-containing protein [Anaerolineae bacterium]